MKELGAMLKAAREAKGLSLADLQMATKIRARQLEAMEAGDFHKLPGEVYIRGFLINYAQHVGLDEDQVLAKYYALKNKRPRKRPTTPPRRPVRKMLRPSGRRRDGKTWSGRLPDKRKPTS